MSAPLRNFAPRKLLTKRAHAAIMPLPIQQSGNNKPFSLKKTRRNWKPNVHIMNMPVNVLGGAPTIAQNLANLNEGKFVRGPHLKRVKLAARDKKTVDKAGGVEGLLVSSGRGQPGELGEPVCQLRDGVLRLGWAASVLLQFAQVA